MSRKALTEGILASFLALDYFVRLRRWVTTAKVLYLELDGSAFNEKHQLGLLLHMTFFENDGTDAAGRMRKKMTTISVCLNSLAIADNISADVWRDDQSMFQKEVPCQMVTAMVMSGNLFDILCHPCVFLGVDKGSETRGGGKGKCGAMMRDAFFGIFRQNPRSHR